MIHRLAPKYSLLNCFSNITHVSPRLTLLELYTCNHHFLWYFTNTKMNVKGVAHGQDLCLPAKGRKEAQENVLIGSTWKYPIHRVVNHLCIIIQTQDIAVESFCDVTATKLW